MSSAWLKDKRADRYSQNGEDGVLKAIFERIGAVNRWCCEFGAWDGINLSNTWNLIKHAGWSGVLIEGDPRRFKDLERNVVGLPVTAKCQYVFTDLDAILSDTDLPFDFDLMSLDVDDEFGNETTHGLDIWGGLQKYQPRVVVFEVGNWSPWEAAIPFAKAKGYELAAHAGNAIFVRRELGHLLSVTSDWQNVLDYRPYFRKPCEQV